MFLLSWGNAGEKGEGKHAGPDEFCDWKGLVQCKSLTPCWLQVDGREIWRAGDGVLREERLDAVTVTVFGEANDEDEPAYSAVRHGEWG